MRALHDIKRKLLAVATLHLVLLFVGCIESKEDSHYGDGGIVPTVFEFTSAGGTLDFSMDAASEWTIAGSAAWVDIRPVQGSGASTITMTVGKFTNYREVRSIEYLFSSTERNIYLTVVQRGESTATLSASAGYDGDIPAAGGTMNLTINSNAEWEITGDMQWCTVSPTSGKGDSTVTVTAHANYAGVRRTAALLVKSDYTPDTASVSISQAAE